MDHSPLHECLRCSYGLSEADCSRVLPLFAPLKVMRHGHLFRTGAVVRHVYFVERGCLRQYYMNAEAGERTIYFKTENGWVSELVSFLDRTATELNVQAVEDSSLQIIDRKSWVYIMTHFPTMTMGFIRAQQDTNYVLKKRLAEVTIESPEERYLRFVEEEPELLRRIPLYLIATYLAMTPETLSRIRRHVARR
ncbi:MAG: Crp/Fnr family transcriptional regulator [Bacteroidetes bacterium]|nr:Crp/Fnr family transcriptional regulator [Bacteroidota bacterium]